METLLGRRIDINVKIELVVVNKLLRDQELGIRRQTKFQ